LKKENNKDKKKKYSEKEIEKMLEDLDFILTGAY